MSKKASIVITKNRVQTSQTEGITQPVTAPPLPKPSTPQPQESCTPSPPNKSASSTFWASNPMVKQQPQPPSVANTTAAATTTQSTTAAGDASVSASTKPKRPRASPATSVVVHPPTSPTPLEQPTVGGSAQGATKGGKQNADVTAAAGIPRVINVRKAELCARGYHSFLDWAADGKNLYIGRSMVQYVPGTVGSKWGNPFPLKKHSLEESLRLYEAHVRSSKELWGALEELAGLEEIGCWCAPAPCHGNVLQRLLAEKLGQQAR